LDEHHSSLGCLLVEPQWGSSAVARSWHPETLRQVMNIVSSYSTDMRMSLILVHGTTINK
jgi:hypothetical protein